MQTDIHNYYRGLLSMADLLLIALVEGYKVVNKDGVIIATPLGA